jgi:uncharacterized protein
MRQMHKQDIILLLNGNRAQLDKYGVVKLGLFGSFVRNEQRADSDVDLLVEFRPEQKNFDNFMHLSFFLEELFERPVELVTPESLSPYLGPKIMKRVEYVVADN